MKVLYSTLEVWGIRQDLSPEERRLMTGHYLHVPGLGNKDISEPDRKYARGNILMALK